MFLPDVVKAIRARYVAKFPVPQGDASPAFEEQARQWSIALAEQVAFERPGEDWGVKRADPGRPIGKDTIARMVNGRLLIWDLLTGTGTGHPTMNENPDSQDVTGQSFVAVMPTDHLGAAPAPSPDPGIPDPTLPYILTRIDDLEDLLGQLQGAFADATKQTQAMVADVYQAQGDTMKAVEKLVAAVSNISVPVVKFPNYSGKVSIPFVGDRTITLKPEGQ